MKDFLMIIRTEGSVWSDLSQDKLQQHLEHGGVYIGQLVQDGKLKTANPVDKGSRLISESNGTMKDVPFNETKEVVAGFFVIQAEDIDAAVAIAKANPIFQDIPTKIEVHPLMAVGG